MVNRHVRSITSISRLYVESKGAKRRQLKSIANHSRKAAASGINLPVLTAAVFLPPFFSLYMHITDERFMANSHRRRDELSSFIASSV